MVGAARQLRLPLSGRLWRGQSGNWAGAGIGSSIDFQDHRTYLPGDDPRYINWQAYARTGHYSMKLYREEVSPHVDVVLDASGSMFFDSAKHTRSWELLYFCRESALQSGTALRMYLTSGDTVRELRHEELDTWKVNLPPATEGAPALASVPWRSGSLRVVITDLLYPPHAPSLLAPLAQSHGRGIYYSIYSRAESDPDWEGHLSFVDSENGTRHRRFVSTDVLERYRQNYGRHFEQWHTETRRHNLLMVRIPAEGDFVEALQDEPMRLGAVESWA
jgi:uncharacterized protein (DUF58 family)